MNLLCAWLVRRFAAGENVPVRARAVDIAPAELMSEAPRSGLRVLTGARYLRNLAALVLLGTAGAALMDYVFKVQAVATFGQGETLLRFFGVYYAAISLITFVVQTSSSRLVLEKIGLAFSTGTPSIALLGRRRQLPWPSRACRPPSWREAASRYSAARCSGPATKSSTRRSRPARNARPSR